MYAINEYGVVKSLARTIIHRGFPRSVKEKTKATSTDRYGYPCLSLSKDGVKKHFTIHRLVALAFIENPGNLEQINHKDGIKTNNHASNLEWCTAKQNVAHSIEIGLKVPHKGKRKYKVQQPKRRKPVQRLDLNGNVVKTYSMINDAREDGFTATHIILCCKGVSKIHKGYKWRYAS